MPGARRDLVVLTADSNALHGLSAILDRPDALGIRAIEKELFPHPQHDSGCFRRCHDFLRVHVNQFAFALVIFDREGCGDERSRDELEADVECRLAANGWPERSAAVVVDPEFDAWVWSTSPHVDKALGWAGRTPPLRDWLSAQGFLADGSIKPARPKEAIEAALKVAGKPRSSARYAEVGRTATLTGCTDAAFQKLLATLRGWFAP